MKYFISLILSFVLSISFSQSDIVNLKTMLLSESPIEEDLQELTDIIGGRVTGSEANIRAVEWAMEKFEEAGVAAKKHPFEMPVLWLEKMCKGSAMLDGNVIDLNIVSKYMSPPGTYSGELIHLEDLNDPNPEIGNKYVIVEQDLCVDIDGLFAEYDYATKVELYARNHGAAGVVFMSSRPRKLLYRFLTMEATTNNMPQFIIAREDASRIIRLLMDGHHVTFNATIDAVTGDSFISHNVVAEIPGTTKRDEVIIIGAHIDSWALGTGANDNGCNVAMMIDIARQLQKLGIRPKRTIRLALWNGEEQGYFGSWAYTRDYDMDKHKLAISIDIGSGGIIGFFTNGRQELVKQVDDLLGPVNDLGPFNQLNIPIVGTDNFDFMLEGVPNLVGIHKPQVYGPNYHASSDTYDKVDLKQLKMNSAIVGAVILGYANSDYNLPRHNRNEIEKMIHDTNLELSMRMFNVWDPWVSGERGRK